MVTAIVLPLISYIGTLLIKLINDKIKNTKNANLLENAVTIVLNSVKTVSQTYVETLKKQNKFDETSQKEAFEKAKEIALSQMNDSLRFFIEENYGDLDKWLSIEIEALVNETKVK